MSSPQAGLSPNNPMKYLGPNVSINTIVTRKRKPTGADLKQPETGKYYPFGTLWILGKDPTTGAYGDMWYLSKIESNVAYWIELGSSNGEFLTADDGIPLPPTDSNWNIVGQKAGTIPVMQTNGASATPSTVSIEDRTYTTAYVVDASTAVGTRGTFSTIQAAIDAAPEETTIFIRAGVYTENITLKRNVNLTGYGNNGGNSAVTIKGTLSFSDDGIITISGIRLRTNGNYCLSVTGSATSRVNLVNCRIWAELFTAINLSSSSATSYVRMINCWFETITVNVAAFTVSGGGSMTLFGCNTLSLIQNTVASTFAGTGFLIIDFSNIGFPITTSNSTNFNADHSEFDTSRGNRQSLILNGNGGGSANTLRSCVISSGTATALSVGNNLTMADTGIYSTNSTSIGGGGTLSYSSLSFAGGNPITTATTLTLSRGSFDAGALYGNFAGSVVTAGYVGESISSIVLFNDPLVVLATGVVSNVTSITLTPGTWDISGIVMFHGLATGTYQNASIGSSSASIANSTYGNNTISATFTNTTVDDVGLSIPSFRENVSLASGGRTIYLKARVGYTGADVVNAYGRISATRVC